MLTKPKTQGNVGLIGWNGITMKHLAGSIIVWLAALLLTAGVSHAANVRLPNGLSDTATDRAWDEALKDIGQNDLVVHDETRDTPTPDQLFTYFLRFDRVTVSDTALRSDTTAMDTTTWSRGDVPYALKFVEVFDTSTFELIDYRKVIRSDTT